MGLVDLFFSVRGRINRAQYWLGSAIASLVLFAGAIAAISAAGGAAEGAPKGEAGLAGAGTFALILVPVALLTCWCGIAVQIKRFHDRGRSWWFVLLPLVPALFMGLAIGESIGRGGSPLELVASVQPYIVISWLINLYIFVELGCLPGVEGANKFGPPPGMTRGAIEPAQSSGAVDAASALFGAQSAMDRAIADRARQTQDEPARGAFAAGPRTVAQPATPSFGRRVTR